MMARLVYKEDMSISEHFGSDSRVKLIILIYRACSETCSDHEEFTSANFCLFKLHSDLLLSKEHLW